MSRRDVSSGGSPDGGTRDGGAVNLKAAAQRLGVHYQTAYKWMRSGELAAIRVGGRYEISEDAIEQFVADRTTPVRERVATDQRRDARELTSDDVLDEFRQMAGDQWMASSSVARFAARRGAENLGDICVAVLMNHDGSHIDQAFLDHREPRRAAFINAVLDTTDARRSMNLNAAAEAYLRGQTVRVHHIDQDQLRSALAPTLRQFLGHFSIFSLLSAPISDAGRPVGFVAFARDTPGRPYTIEDEHFATRLGETVGALVRTASEVELAGRIRRELAEDLRTYIAAHGSRGLLEGAGLNRVMREHADTAELPVAILGADGRYSGANDRLLSETGYPLDAIIGQHLDAFTHPNDRGRERHGFVLLTSGELDHYDLTGGLTLADGSQTGFAVHRTAVRGTDKTLACVVSVGRLLHLQTTTSEGTATP